MYEFIYNEEEQTLHIKMGEGQSFWGGAFIVGAVIFAVVFLCVAEMSVGSILLVVFGVVPSIGFMIWLLRKEKKSYFLLSKEGISYVEPKQQQYLRWDECNFIGIYHYGVAHTSPGLIISKHVPQRNEKGEIPKSYPWPKEETIDLTGAWCYFSDEGQRRVLELCGGMRG